VPFAILESNLDSRQLIIQSI